MRPRTSPKPTRLPAEDLEGRADIILFSWGPGVSLFKPWTWFTDARWGRFFHLLG